MLLGAITINLETMIPYWSWFLDGAITTVLLSLVTVISGTIIGFVLTLMKRSSFKPLNFLGNLYTTVIRGTPVLLQLVIIVFGLPSIGLKIPDILGIARSGTYLAAVLALSINSGAYICEIFRAGLNSVDVGQSEAARSLGLSSQQTMRKIIVPQAVKTILPSLVNEFIMMIKETSLVSTLGIADLMYTRNTIQGATYRIFEPLIVIAIIYLVLTMMLTSVSGVIERKLNKDA